MEILYDIASLILAICIVAFSSMTVFYGVNYLIITKLKKRFDWIVAMQIAIHLAWVIIFGYITYQTIVDIPPLVAGTFGAIFIRPVILLSSVAASIWMHIRYMFEKTGRSDRWNLPKN